MQIKQELLAHTCGCQRVVLQLCFALAVDERRKTEKQHNKVNYNSLNELLQKHILPFEVTL